MTHLFYFLVLTCLILQVFFIMKKKYTRRLAKIVLRMIKQRDSNHINVFGKFLIYGSISLVSHIIFFIGLFSSQWILFLALFLITVFAKKLIRKYLLVSYTRHVINILILLFILVNEYYLHIDIIKLFFG